MWQGPEAPPSRQNDQNAHHPAPESGIFSTTSEQWGWLPSQASRP